MFYVNKVSLTSSWGHSLLLFFVSFCFLCRSEVTVHDYINAVCRNCEVSNMPLSVIMLATSNCCELPLCVCTTMGEPIVQYTNVSPV